MSGGAPASGTAERGGVIQIDKPAGPTSHDVVARVRRICGTRQVGHTGTLDPFATGLLLVCLGPATRLAEYLTGLPKTYRATVRLGTATDTDDPTGATISSSEAWRFLDPGAVETALLAQIGTIAQRPPAFSAKQVRGERMYARARRGDPVEVAPVMVEIRRIELLELRLPELDVEVECGSGTYIRAIARDLGEALGVGGHLQALRRTAVGAFRVGNAIPLDALGADACSDAVLTPAEALRHLPRLRVSPNDAANLGHGRRIAAPDDLPSDVPVAVLDPAGALIAVAERRGNAVQPRKVFG